MVCSFGGGSELSVTGSLAPVDPSTSRTAHGPIKPNHCSMGGGPLRASIPPALWSGAPGVNDLNSTICNENIYD